LRNNKNPPHGIMQHQDFFLYLPIILLSARLFAELAARAHTPPVIGELLAGVILGPSLLGWIEPSETIKLMAEIGIILLLFGVGLETDVRRLIRSGAQSLIVALAGFLVPLAAGFMVSYLVFGMDLLVSMFVGGTLTATSIGITVRVLADLGRQHSREGQVVLGAAVIDDVLGVMLLALLYEFSIGGGISLVNTGKVMLFVAFFFVAAPVAAKLMAFLIKRAEHASGIPGLVPASIVSLVLLFAWSATYMGAPELLGGFAAGLALSRRFFLPFGIALHADESFAERIEEQMKPILYLFTPIFFVFVGLSLNLREIDWGSPFIWGFSSLMLIVALVGKMAGSLLIRAPWATRGIIGLSMIPRGEVGLIFAELGRASDIFSNEIYAGLVIVIAITTLLPPFAMKWFYGRWGHHLVEE
jgi:Kef-type K+ transport system membrane component KefB